MYGSHTKIRRDHSVIVVVVVGHLPVACNWAGNHSLTPVSITTRQGEICMGDVAEFASTKGDLVVANLKVSLEGYLPLILPSHPPRLDAFTSRVLLAGLCYVRR